MGSSYIVLHIRRRHRPRTSIAAYFLRLSRSCGIGRLQARTAKRGRPLNSTCNEEPPHCDDLPPGDDESTPVVVTPPRYAEILNARRAQIQLESEPIWPVFACRQKFPKIQPKIPVIPDRRSCNQRIKTWRAAAGCVRYFPLLLPLNILDHFHTVLQPDVFFHFFLHVPAPSLLRCGDVASNPGPFNVSEAINDLESYQRFTFKLRSHVINLIHHAEFSTIDFEALDYRSSNVKDGVSNVLLENSVILPTRNQAARAALSCENRTAIRQNDTSNRILARAVLSCENLSAIRQNNTSNRILARKIVKRGLHPTPCIYMDAHEILVDRQQPIPFVMSSCPHCKCLRDKSEARLCCNMGKRIISYDDFPIWPREFMSVLDSVWNIGEKSRELNNLCNFSSMGTSTADGNPGFEYRQNHQIPQMYHLSGRTFHRIPGPKRSRDGEMMYYNHHPDPSIYVDNQDFTSLRQYMAENNELAHELKTISDLAYDTLRVYVHPEDAPSNKEESFSLHGTTRDCFHPPSLMGVVLPHSGNMVSVPESSQLFETAQYPLLFPQGRGGYYNDLSLSCHSYRRPWYVDACNTPTSEISSVADFTKYVLYQKCELLMQVHTCAQQYILDQFSRWQSMIFDVMAKNQSVTKSIKARVARYADIIESKEKKKAPDSRPIFMPASVPGSPAHQKREIRNGLSIFARKGNPHMFITFTGNAKWPDFIAAVKAQVPGIADDDINAILFPDLMARVFRKRLAECEKDLRSGKIFGDKMCYIQRVIEFQKRGMPHAHICLRLGPAKDRRGRQTKITAQLADSWVSTRLFYHEECPLWAEYPNDSDESIQSCFNRKECACAAHVLGRMVKSKMLHTKCDPSRCQREDGSCKRGYPKAAGTDESSRTWCDARGYWHHKRLYACDARVVPYNRALLLRYNAHINVEISGTVKVICYLKKYMTKLPDCSRSSIDAVYATPSIEFTEWQKLRHTSVSEACLRMRGIDLNSSSVGCTQLFAHKKGQHSVRFWDDETATEAAANAASIAESNLLRYFWRNKKLRHLKFEEYFSRFVLQASLPKREGRKYFEDTPKNLLCSPMYAVERTTMHIARLEMVHTKDPELRALRSLLRVKAAYSFTNLRRVLEGDESTLYPTFVEAADACGLCTGSDDAARVMEEMINPCVEAWKNVKPPDMVVFTGEPRMLRYTFIMLAMSGSPVAVLFEDFWRYLAIDLPLGKRTPVAEIPDDIKMHYLLTELSKLLFQERMTLADIGLPELGDEIDIMAEEILRYPQMALETVARGHDKLNPSQRVVVETIERAVQEQIISQCDQQKLFFLDGKPGRGKTFVTNVIASRLRLKKLIVAICSPSAKGAIQYMGALTSHKTFGIPIFDGEPTAPLQPLFTKNHRNARFLFLANLIVIDEAPMMHSCAFDMIDRFLREIMGVDVPFGGKVVLCSGDFGQLSPVTFMPGRASALAVSIKDHESFKFFKRLLLRKSERHVDDPGFTGFTDALADGNGMDGYFDITVPPSIFMSTDERGTLAKYFYGALDYDAQDPLSIMKSRLYRSAIIAYTNEDVVAYNNIVAEHVYTSLGLDNQWWSLKASECPTEGECNLATPEAMEVHEEPGVPSHELRIFPGALLSLMRNYLPSRGLVNGALLLPVSHTRNTVEVINVTPNSPFYGEHQTLFRFMFTMGVKQLMNFTRKQFPLRYAYAGTVHRYQGDTVYEKLLLDCRVHSFAHGQLSVAFSRATKASNVSVLGSETDVAARKVTGLVYREFLSFEDDVTAAEVIMNVQGTGEISADDCSEDEEAELQRQLQLRNKAHVRRQRIRAKK